MKKYFELDKNRIIYFVQELKNKGLSMYQINQLVQQQHLIKLNKKCYKNTDYIGDENDFYYVSAYIPKGVICLLSASVYYGLTTYRPDAVDVAVPRHIKISTFPEWPQINCYYLSDDRWKYGVKDIYEGQNQFKIYDVEKTVVDIVYYRERVGIEETKEILVNYLKRPERNLDQLVHYAEMLKCDKVLKKYLEVLV